MTARILTFTLVLCLPACKGQAEATNATPDRAEPTAETAAPQAAAERPAAGKLPGLPQVALEKVAGGMAAPTNITTAPDGTMVVLDQTGLAYRLAGNALEPFADLSKKLVNLRTDYDERGLLGMAFHPDYPKVRRVFAWYSAPLRKSAPEGYDHTNVLSSFEVTAEGRVDSSSEKQLIVLDWIAPNHDGGTVAFGPDRMLYLSLGDGGKASDMGGDRPPMGHGQDWRTLQGTIIRIDPDGATEGKPYGIPQDNPFVGDHEGADEVWAYGFRNPYAFSFDSKTGTLFAGDVGQELLEEVNIVERGKNYGWNVKEGTRCFNKDNPNEVMDECDAKSKHGEELVDPVMQYAQIDSALATNYDVHGVSVIAGHVYHGSAIPALEGAFIFGDWSRNMGAPEGVLMAGRKVGDGWALERLPVKDAPREHIGRFVRGFGQDAKGEIYVLTSDERGPSGETGTVWRLTAG